MSLFQNGRGITVWDMQSGESVGESEDKGERETLFYREKGQLGGAALNLSPLEESEGLGWSQHLVGWAVTGPGESLPSAAGAAESAAPCPEEGSPCLRPSLQGPRLHFRWVSLH